VIKTRLVVLVEQGESRGGVILVGNGEGVVFLFLFSQFLGIVLAPSSRWACHFVVVLFSVLRDVESVVL
jgi:hypothetical protein